MAPSPSGFSLASLTKAIGKLLAPLSVLVIITLVWQIVVVAFRIHPIVLPSPIAVANSLWKEGPLLLRAASITGQAALCGLVCSTLLGFFIAIFFSQSAWLRAAFYPYVIFLQTVPIVAIAPLLIIWSGNNFRTIVLVSVIISIFPSFRIRPLGFCRSITTCVICFS